MSDDLVDRLEISRVTGAMRADALEVVFAYLQPTDRASQVADLLESAQQNRHALDGLLVASASGEPLGAGLVQSQPGRAAVVWPPPAVLNMQPRAADALMRELLALARRGGARIAQTLLAVDQPGEETLIRAGFHHASDLAFLFASTEFASPDDAEAGLTFEAYSADSHQRLLAIIEKTYIDTLDCPAMNGVRDPVDVLEGYRATGSFSPERWLIVRQDQRDVGCLLLADHPRVEQWELVYMGLAPAARGRGHGAILARRALWMARQAGRRRIVVAVDLANRPALRAYESVGFVSWETRRVFLKRLDDQ